ncbi:MAG: DUF2000 family protein [Mesorhizobium sp.]|nr:MAG: DUF2000 family protein [Mesorhizobium sp.]
MFDTKFAIVLQDDLPVWQKLNVTAFLTSGIVAQYSDIIGEPYRDRAGNIYNPLAPDDAKVVGIAVRAEKKLVDKITRGARMHP